MRDGKVRQSKHNTCYEARRFVNRFWNKLTCVLSGTIISYKDERRIVFGLKIWLGSRQDPGEFLKSAQFTWANKIFPGWPPEGFMDFQIWSDINYSDDDIRPFITTRYTQYRASR